MIRRPFFTALAFIVITSTIAAFGSALLRSDPEHARPPHVRPADSGRALAPLPLAAVGGEHPEAAIELAEAVYAAAINEAIYGAMVDEALRAAREAAARAVPRGTRSGGSGVGDCTGFPLPDYIIERESGGNPWAVNPSSGAYGCAQVMPFHWAPGGACAGLDRTSIEDQRTCVGWLSEGGTRLSPWNATR